MSRCFPFPPPGYERKDGGDLLDKEKHRDKKPKKDKKDKDKRDKDRSDGKHREKKGKKEKRRDKDREKKRDKEKEADKAGDKSKAPDEKRLLGQPEPLGGEKLVQKESRERNNSVDKKVPGQIGGHRAEKLSQNSYLVDESKFVKDFGWRIKDDATITGNHFSPVDRRKDEGLPRFETKSASTFAAIKEMDKRAEIKPTEWKNTTRDGARPGRNAMVQSTAGTIQNKFKGLPRLLDKSIERKMEGNEIPKDNDDIRGVKSQEKDKERKSHGKDKDRDREKKKEDRDKKKEDREKRKADKQKKKDEKKRKKEEKERKREAKEKEKSQVQNAELNKVKGSNQHDTDNHALKSPQLPKQTNIIAPTEANPKKRKDFETNGTTVHDHTAEDALPNKLPRPSTSSSHPPPLENGRVLEHCQTYVPTPEKKVVPNNTKTESKERKINGVTEAQPLSVSPMKVKPTIDQPPKPLMKQPHPDFKYLSQIYSVPKIEDFLGYEDDEEDWLFGGVTKKPKVEPSNPEEEEMPQVWAAARKIDSADIFALPYVVPY